MVIIGIDYWYIERTKAHITVIAPAEYFHLPGAKAKKIHT